MTTRIGLNGVGRLGRSLWRILRGAPDLAIVAANDTTGDLDILAHLLRYDTVRGRWPGTVETAAGGLVVDGARIPFSHEPTPDRIDWDAHAVDLVIEATGAFARGPAARGHLRGGAPTVVVTAATPDADVCLMMGINEHVFDPQRHRVVSNSCCSTYCVGAMLHPLHQAYGVCGGSVTLAYSHGSRPGPPRDTLALAAAAGKRPNPRLVRGDALTLVPANIPGIRHALDRVLPDLAGRIAATAFRVPVGAASAAALALRLAEPASAEEVNATLQAASTTLLKGYLEVADAPIVSGDVVGAAASCLVDPELTTVAGDLVQVVGWYDNEWGYAHRLVDLARMLTRRPRQPHRTEGLPPGRTVAPPGPHAAAPGARESPGAAARPAAGADPG